MAQWDLLRVADVRDAYRLIGECRDLGDEPELWQGRLSEGLLELFQTPANGGEGIVDRNGSVTAVSAIERGFDARTRAAYAEFHHDGATARDPLISALRAAPGSVVTRTRRQVVGDAVYERSPVVQRYLRPAGVWHRLVSLHLSADARTVAVVHLHRSDAERDFGPRDAQLLELVHGEVGRLIGGPLVSATEPAPGSLPRRLRQTLVCLIEGDTEKQVAARLGLSPATTHQYVAALYRRYGVRSRAQLMGYVLKRARRAEWQRFLDADE